MLILKTVKKTNKLVLAGHADLYLQSQLLKGQRTRGAKFKAGPGEELARPILTNG
jgi:hypothetical protein